jgi:hypothetical protein
MRVEDLALAAPIIVALDWSPTAGATLIMSRSSAVCGGIF